MLGARTRVILVAGLVMVALPIASCAVLRGGREVHAGVQSSNEQAQELALLQCGRTDRIRLPMEWWALRDWRPTGTAVRNATGGWTVGGEWVSRDVVGMDEEGLLSALRVLGPYSGPPAAALPRDSRLLLHWHRDTGEVTFHDAAALATQHMPPSALTNVEFPFPSTPELQARRKTVPPDEMRWWVRHFDPMTEQWTGGRAGLGLAGILASDGGYLAAGGEGETGPDGTTAWLYAGRDVAGDIWLWFAEE